MRASLKTICTHLNELHEILDKIDQVDIMTSALYRQIVQDILATPTIDITLRQEIADRINQINRLLMLRTVGSEDSY